MALDVAVEAQVAESIVDAWRTGALEAARRDAGPNDRIIVFGSFYTVAEALRYAR